MQNIEALLNEFGPCVYGFIVSKVGKCDDADDIYQTVFLRLLEKRPVFFDKRAVRAWLFKTAYNCAMDLFRTRQKTCPLTDEMVANDSDNDIFDIISHLDEAYRDVIYLFYQEDMKIKEIAKVLELKEGTVKTRLRRARAQLLEFYKEEIL